MVSTVKYWKYYGVFRSIGDYQEVLRSAKDYLEVRVSTGD